jgi:enamine deaminase RidA (YjgF/YER057c/UK114 family)
VCGWGIDGGEVGYCRSSTPNGSVGNRGDRAPEGTNRRDVGAGGAQRLDPDDQREVAGDVAGLMEELPPGVLALTARVHEIEARTARSVPAAQCGGEVLSREDGTSITGAMATIEHLNPDGLHANPAFTQAVKVAGSASLVIVGGQNGVDASGDVVGDDPYAQAQQALRNVQTAMEAAGGSVSDIVKWTILVTDPAALGPGFGAFQELWGDRPNPPAITVSVVSALAHPQFLVEVEAIAALPG